jgi:hypothetical protein
MEGGLGFGYIVRMNEPQPSDQTDIDQWWRCLEEFGWNTLRERERDWYL